MKNKILIINPHSTVDVITNSSSELFVCDTDKSVTLVEDYIHAEIALSKDEDGCWDYSNERKNCPSGDNGEYSIETLDEYIDFEFRKREYEKQFKHLTDDEVRLNSVMDNFYINEDRAKELINKKLLIINIDQGLIGIINGLKEKFNAIDFDDFINNKDVMEIKK